MILDGPVVRRGERVQWVGTVCGPMPVYRVRFGHACGRVDLYRIMRVCRIRLVLNGTHLLYDCRGSDAIGITYRWTVENAARGRMIWRLCSGVPSVIFGSTTVGGALGLQSTDTLAVSLDSGERRAWPNRRGGITVTLAETLSNP